jgi:hypothetical protein
MIPYDVTDSPPAWSLTGRPVGRGRQFYIDADVTGGWPYQAEETLCKFGVTAKGPQVRCAQNQKNLRLRWDIEADLRVCFAASGQIACEEVEERVRDHSLAWLPEAFGENAEWRRCCPRQLARIAVLITERLTERQV